MYIYIITSSPLPMIPLIPDPEPDPTEPAVLVKNTHVLGILTTLMFSGAVQWIFSADLEIPQTAHSNTSSCDATQPSSRQTPVQRALSANRSRADYPFRADPTKTAAELSPHLGLARDAYPKTYPGNPDRISPRVTGVGMAQGGAVQVILMTDPARTAAELSPQLGLVRDALSALRDRLDMQRQSSATVECLIAAIGLGKTDLVLQMLKQLPLHTQVTLADLRSLRFEKSLENKKVSYLELALVYGACKGHGSLVMALLKTYGIGLRFEDYPYLRMALSQSARLGHTSLVLALLDLYPMALTTDGKDQFSHFLNITLQTAARFGKTQVILALLDQYGMGDRHDYLSSILPMALYADQLELIHALLGHYTLPVKSVDDSVLLLNSIFRESLMGSIRLNQHDVFSCLMKTYPQLLIAENLNPILKQILFPCSRSGRMQQVPYIKTLFNYCDQKGVVIEDRLRRISLERLLEHKTALLHSESIDLRCTL